MTAQLSSSFVSSSIKLHSSCEASEGFNRMSSTWAAMAGSAKDSLSAFLYAASPRASLGFLKHGRLMSYMAAGIPWVSIPREKKWKLPVF